MAFEALKALFGLDEKPKVDPALRRQLKSRGMTRRLKELETKPTGQVRRVKRTVQPEPPRKPTAVSAGPFEIERQRLRPEVRRIVEQHSPSDRKNIFQPLEPKPVSERVERVGKFAIRTGISFLDMATEAADFAIDYAKNRPVETISKVFSFSQPLGVPKLEMKGESAERIVNENLKQLWRGILNKIPSRQAKEAVDYLEQHDVMQNRKEWEDASLLDKFTKHLPETLYNIGPSIISSFGLYALNRDVGTAVIAGSTANEIKDEAIANGWEEKDAEQLGLFVGLPVGIIDRIVPDRLFSTKVVKNQFLSKFVRGLTESTVLNKTVPGLRALETGGLEAGTEAMQEAIQLFGNSLYREVTGQEARERLLFSAGAGLFGGVGGDVTVNFVRNLKAGKYKDIPIGLTIKEVGEKPQEIIKRKAQEDDLIKNVQITDKTIRDPQGNKAPAGVDPISRELFVNEKELQSDIKALLEEKIEIDGNIIKRDGRTDEQMIDDYVDQIIEFEKRHIKNITIEQAQKRSADLQSKKQVSDEPDIQAVGQRELEQQAKKTDKGFLPGQIPALEFKRFEEQEARLARELEQEQKILQARGANLEFTDGQEESGYQIFKQLANKRKDILESDVDDVKLKEIIANSKKVLSKIVAPKDIDDLIFQSQRGTTNDELIEQFKDRYDKEVELRKLAKTKTPSEVAQRAKKMAEKTVRKETKRPVRRIKQPTIKKREKTLLKERFRQQAKGARAGAREGVKIEKVRQTEKARIKLEKQKRRSDLKELRKGIKQRIVYQDIIESIRVARGDVASLKTAIREYATENLPISERGRFMTVLDNAKTMTDAIKAFSRIDIAVKNLAKKELVAELKKKIAKIEKSKNIAVDYKQKISGLVEELDMKKRTKKTLDSLRATKKYIDRQTELGYDMELPQKIYDRLAILSKKPIGELSAAEIKNIISDIELLEQLGKTKQAVRERLREAEKKKIKEDILENVVSIEKHPLIERDIAGPRLKTSDRIKNLFIKAVNGAQQIDLSITPMDVFFDLLDGGEGKYDGPAYTFIKQKQDINYQNYLQQKDTIIDKIWNKADELNLDTQNFERIGIHAARAQEGGREKLQNTGLTDAQIDSVILAKDEMKMYDLMRNEMDKIRKPIAEVMRTVYNRELGEVENYFSFMTDFDAMSDTEVFQRIGGEQQEFGRATKEVEKGFTLKRTGPGKQKIKLDAMEIFTKHIDNASYLINMAKDQKMIFEIANSSEFGEKAGDLGQRITLEWLDLVSRKGGKNGDQQIAILDTVRRNVGIGVLGFKLSSALIQPTALMDGATMLGPDVFRGAGEVITNKNIREFIIDKMPELRDRIADDPSFRELSKYDNFAKIQKAGYKPLQVLDSITASSIAWTAYTQKMKELGLPIDLNTVNEEASVYAQKIVRRTQASGMFKDVPLAISRGKLTGNKSIDKALLQFQTFMLNRWSLIRHDAYRAGIKNKDFKKSFSIFFWLTVALLTEEGLRRASKELVNLLTGKDDDDEDGYTEKVVKSAVSTIPFVSQIMGVAVYGSDAVPAIGVAEKVVKAGKQIVSGKEKETKLRGVTNLFGSAGALFGLPGSIQSSQIFRDLLSEKKSTGTTRSIKNRPKIRRLKSTRTKARRIKR